MKKTLPLLLAMFSHFERPKTKEFDPKKKCSNCVFYENSFCKKTGLKMSKEGGMYCTNFVKRSQERLL